MCSMLHVSVTQSIVSYRFKVQKINKSVAVFWIKVTFSDKTVAYTYNFKNVYKSLMCAKVADGKT